jgi:centrin-1
MMDVKDLRVAMRALGFDASKDEAKLLAEKISTPGKDGRTITFDAFVEAMSERIAGRDSKEEIAKAFALFDEEHTGKINLKTLKKIAKDLGETMTDQELEEMIVEADADGDGEVTLDDFVKIMQSTNLY